MESIEAEQCTIHTLPITQREQRAVEEVLREICRRVCTMKLDTNPLIAIIELNEEPTGLHVVGGVATRGELQKVMKQDLQELLSRLPPVLEDNLITFIVHPEGIGVFNVSVSENSTPLALTAKGSVGVMN